MNIITLLKNVKAPASYSFYISLKLQCASHSLMVYFFLEFLDLNHSFKYRYHSIFLQCLNGLLKTHNTEEGMSTLPKNLSVLTVRM